MKAFLDEMRQLLGERQVLTEPDVTASYCEDWTHRWVGSTPAVVRPGSTDEVAAVVAAARRNQVALVPQGGNTGLVGGGVPHTGEVVLSLRRMTGLEPVDELAGQVTVDAGVTLAALHEHVGAAGLAFGVDLAARGSATIGGMVATNAGGLHVLRYGPMRAQVVGLEAVLGTGEVVSRLSGLVKDNTGYDLSQLMCGSEGTLGIVTRARLKLIPRPGELAVALVALPTVADTVSFAARLRRAMAGVRALEMMVGDSLARAAELVGVPPPAVDGAGSYLLVEVEGAKGPEDALAEALAGEGAGVILDAAVTASTRDREQLWQYREMLPEVVVRAAHEAGVTAHKLDVTLPQTKLAGFCADVTEMLQNRWPGTVSVLFGHVGDGNIHVNVVPPADTGSGDAMDDAVLELVVAVGGSVSAEHGIGVAKRDWLVRNRSAGEIATMRAIKQALDPDSILNPNVLLT